MNHRNYKRKMISVICDNCGKEFLRPVSEVKRARERGRHLYCSRECVSKGTSAVRKNMPYRPASEKMLKHLENICGNRKDGFSPFRYTLRCASRRWKNVDISLQDLKEVWEKQNGVCPYSGVHLILPTNANLKEIDYFHRASLDRIDSSGGYTRDNIQFVSTAINFLKNTQTDNDVRKFLKEISNYTSNLSVTD